MDLEMLVSNLPAGWYEAAASTVHHQPGLQPWPVDPPVLRDPTPDEQHLELALVHRLGWSQLGYNRPVCLVGLTVKQATSLQLGPVRAARQHKFAEFVAEAAEVGQRIRAKPGVGCLRHAQRHLWSLKWDNHYKEIFWRLPLNGLCTAARIHDTDAVCVCGSSVPGRRHHYWECPIAQGVVQSILDNLPAAWCSRPETRPPLLAKHLWLMQPPPGPRRMHPGVWKVVCLAALNAMDVGRRAANEHRVTARQAVPNPVLQADQPSIASYLQHAPLTPAQMLHNQQVQQRRQQQEQQLAAQRLEVAKQQAVAKFWLLLTDFSIMRAAPDAWTPHVAEDHPFLCFEPLVDTIVLAPRGG